MGRKGVRVVVLCEDDEHWRFSRLVLLKLNYSDREIRSIVAPGGRGSGEQWVRTRYPIEVSVHRRKIKSQEVRLLVVIDADRALCTERHRILERSLHEQGEGGRGPNERIVIWIPRRHIETWIVFLSGQDANEEDDYKRVAAGIDYRAPAARFVDLRHAQRTKSLPALNDAFDELRRLE